MKTDKQDILTSSEELKKMPFSVPEGYFSSLEASILEKTERRQPLRWRIASRSMQLIPAAAVLALIVTAGLFLSGLGRDGAGTPESDYAFLRSADLIPVTEPESLYLSYYDETSSELSAEDIVNYLITIGVEPEELVTE